MFNSSCMNHLPKNKRAGVRAAWQGHDIDSGRLNVAGSALSALLQFHFDTSCKAESAPANNVSVNKNICLFEPLTMEAMHYMFHDGFHILVLNSLLALMVVFRSLWNEPMLCMLSTVWTKRFCPLYSKPPPGCSLVFRPLSSPWLPVNLCISELIFSFVSRNYR